TLVPGRSDEADDLLLEPGGALVLVRRDTLSRPREPLARGVLHSRAPPPWCRSYRPPAPLRSRRAAVRSRAPAVGRARRLEATARPDRSGARPRSRPPAPWPRQTPARRAPRAPWPGESGGSSADRPQAAPRR